MFAKLKTVLRAKALRTVDALWDALGKIAGAITPAECKNYLKNAGYFQLPWERSKIGVSFSGFNSAMLLAPVTLGAGGGLFLGKQVGVSCAVLAAIKFGIGQKSKGFSYSMLCGVDIPCGMGFTISLFISALAFTDTAMIVKANTGIIAGSLMSAIVGYAWLRRIGVGKPM